MGVIMMPRLPKRYEILEKRSYGSVTLGACSVALRKWAVTHEYEVYWKQGTSSGASFRTTCRETAFKWFENTCSDKEKEHGPLS
jgi:hypothetical protein